MSVETEEKRKIIFLVEDNKADVRLIQEAFKNSSLDRKSTRLNSSHVRTSRMPSSA